jgi:hypothetical protein
VHHALVTPPFLVDLAYTHGHDRRSTGIDAAAPTQTGQQTLALVQPFLVSLNHSDLDRVRGLDVPMPTAMPHTAPALCVPPYLVDLRGQNAPRALDSTLSTVCSSGNHHWLIVPPAFLTSYYANGQPHEVSDPVPTQDTRDRHALVVPLHAQQAEARQTYAEAEAAATLALLRDCAAFIGPPSDHPRDDSGMYDLADAVSTFLQAPHPGAALLAELDAARRVVRFARANPSRLVQEPLIAYDAVVSAGADLPTPPWSALLGAVQAVVRSWEALSNCEGEFLPEYPEACAEWAGALDEGIAELKQQLENVTSKAKGDRTGGTGQ